MISQKDIKIVSLHYKKIKVWTIFKPSEINKNVMTKFNLNKKTSFQAKKYFA